MSGRIFDLIDLEWLNQANQQIQSGINVETVLQNVPLTDGRILPTISHKTFKNALNFNQIEIPKLRTGPKPKDPPQELINTVQNLHNKVQKIGISRAFGRIITDRQMILESQMQNQQNIQIHFPIPQLSQRNQNSEFDYSSPDISSSSEQLSSEISSNSDDSSAEELFSSSPNSIDTESDINSEDDPYSIRTNTTSTFEKTTDYFDRKLLNIQFSERTVNKCFKLLNLAQPPKNSKAKGQTKYEAFYVNEIWHVDIHFLNHRQGEYLYAVIDDKSRKILAWSHLETKEAAQTSRVIQQCFDVYGKPFAIWSDNGLENYGVFKNLLKNANVESITIIPHCPYMNGKIERFWQNIQVDEVAWDQIQNLIENYNATPHTQLPKNPEIHTWFTPNKFYDISEKYDTTKEPLWKVDGEIKDLRISLQHFRERRANQRN